MDYMKLLWMNAKYDTEITYFSYTSVWIWMDALDAIYIDK